jgi:hypothetical protein
MCLANDLALGMVSVIQLTAEFGGDVSLGPTGNRAEAAEPQAIAHDNIHEPFSVHPGGAKMGHPRFGKAMLNDPVQSPQRPNNC